MRRFLIVLLLSLVPLSLISADIIQTFADADALHDGGKCKEAKALLLGAVEQASDGKLLSECLWRVSRETLELGDLAEKAKLPQAEVLKLFEEGQGYADKAIAADPANDLGYYWKSSNVGRWGQVKGILDSLAQAKPMKDLLSKVVLLNPERADAYFVLGQLYRELPGWPLSFGDIDAAVSYGRKAVELRAQQMQSGAEKDPGFGFIVEAAKTLYKRNRSAEARIAEQKKLAAKYKAAATALDRASSFEAALELKNVSDRQEAKAMLQGAIAEAGKMASLTVSQEKDVQKARDTLKGW